MASHRPSDDDEPTPPAPPRSPAPPPRNPAPMPVPPSLVTPPPARPPARRADDGSVVPLRPYGLGDILRGTSRVVRRAPALITGVVLLAFAVQAAVGVAAGPTASFSIRADDDGYRTVKHLVIDRHIGATIADALTGFVVVVILAALVPIVLRLTAGRSGATDVGAAGRAAVAAVLVGLVGVPLPLLQAELVGRPGAILVTYPVIALQLWISVGIGLAPDAAAGERSGPFAAAARSWRLVRGSWWRSLGILLVLTLPTIVLAGIVGGYYGVRGARLQVGDTITVGGSAFAVLTAAVGALTAAAITIGRTLLYVDLRCRKEGLAWSLEAARAGDDRPDFGLGGVYGPVVPPVSGPAVPSGS